MLRLIASAAYVCGYVCVCVTKCSSWSVKSHTCVCVDVNMCLCVCVFCDMCMCVCVHVCVCMLPWLKKNMFTFVRFNRACGNKYACVSISSTLIHEKSTRLTHMCTRNPIQVRFLPWWGGLLSQELLTLEPGWWAQFCSHGRCRIFCRSRIWCAQIIRCVFACMLLVMCLCV